MEHRKIPPGLQGLIPVADAIAAAVGPYCEVVLHDISRPERSVVYMAGNVTNRSIGAPLTDMVLRRLREQGDAISDLPGYHNVTKDGKTLRSSTTFVRDGQGKVIGCLCVNIDQTPLVSWRHFLENSLFSAPGETNETFATGANHDMRSNYFSPFIYGGSTESTIYRCVRKD